jgi:exopolysaccharide biosynthesis polyprenyl glycosylphosphotransferase
MEPLPTPIQTLADPGANGPVTGAVELTNLVEAPPAGGIDSPRARAIISDKGSFPAAQPQSESLIAGAAQTPLRTPGHGTKSTQPASTPTMTPPQAATHVAAPRAGVIVPRRPPSQLAANICRRVLDTRDWARLKLLSDLVVLYLASSLALFADPSVRGVTSNRWLAAVFPLVVAAILRARRSPDEHLNVSLLDTLAHVLGVVSLAAMLTISVDSILGGADPLALAPRLWLFAVVYLGVTRATLVSLRHQAMSIEALATPTLIVGAGMIGAHLVKRLVGEPSYGLRPVGFLDADPLPAAELPGRPAVPVLGGPENLGAAIAQTGARHVILAFSSEPDHVLVAKVRECQALGVDVSLVPRLYESINERTTLDHLGGLPLLTLHSIDPRGWQFAIKHAIDRTVAGVTLLLASPVMLAVAIAVRSSSPGPILFRQRRVGRDGREFDVLKFRTMRTARPAGDEFEPPEGCAPGGVEGSDRRTPIGRILRDLSLDELPQLINVLRGDMSLVGPRPERPEYVARFVRDVERYEDRHRVKSGITGWAQVHGLRGQTSIADRVEWDNYYIQNWSLRLDLRIVVLTVAEILRFRG